MGIAESFELMAAEYNNASVWKAPISYDLNGILALVFLLFSFSIISVITLSDKSSFQGSVRYVILSAIGSLLFGFGSVLFSNYVGVYV
ncbi:hypothetical protein WICANDRAFT_68610 [Wickerhamomyces anomalus NRRL Y-366-8]|uniref:Dolichyl-diphosphooligosaccharide-protein glycosyltransferase subunit OST5 n=1 Tax=Wickerhamomyces anomalus (strain ATCC 58044 / CBS 1984 / NCYC 433 / NRRL Y-366-8) TaxID=683960 RepID=A0A1E3P3J9_WICAA|nr:uncharacterized protein WICANDRAFT_68610 [Wickerhamomyces anomalus NRRL Y-366-8]ODQ60061.1 hypothetical protein WICANDRAFT_68610 [Wickerhamomyces anomalus NRRL Y-366-8]